MEKIMVLDSTTDTSLASLYGHSIITGYTLCGDTKPAPFQLHVCLVSYQHAKYYAS